MVDVLSYSISERNFDKKIAPYLKKISNSTKSVVSEYYHIDGSIITKEREVTSRLIDGTKVNSILHLNKEMVVILPSRKDKVLVNKLERLIKK